MSHYLRESAFQCPSRERTIGALYSTDGGIELGVRVKATMDEGIYERGLARTRRAHHRDAEAGHARPVHGAESKEVFACLDHCSAVRPVHVRTLAIACTMKNACTLILSTLQSTGLNEAPCRGRRRRGRRRSRSLLRECAVQLYTAQMQALVWRCDPPKATVRDVRL